MNNATTPKKKTLETGLIAAGVITAMAISGAAVAGGGHRGGGPGGIGFGLMRMIRHLDLSEEQEVKAVRLRHQLKEERKAGMVDRKAMMTTVAAELQKPEPDAAKLHGLADTMMARMNTMTHSMIDKFLELHKTFTPEQREKLVKGIERRADRKEHRGRRARGKE